MRLALVLTALGLVGMVVLQSTAVWLGVGALLAFAAATYLGVFAAPSLLVSVGLALTVFSGNSDELGLPLGPDRLFVAAGLAALALDLPGVRRERAIVWRPLHGLLAAVAAIAVISSFAAGTLETTEGVFGLLDRLGLVPFVVFSLAPLLFGTRRDRDALLAVLVGTGGYLGVTAVLEGTGNLQWVVPSYIADPGVGIHFGRARGPFVESVAFGLALYGCAVASAVAFATWTTTRARRLAALVCVLCMVGTIFTLTRAVWLATIVATVLALALSPRTRTFLMPLAALGAAALLVALAVVPGFANAVSQRSGDERPLWDRFNTNRAALEMVRTNPLTGVGWNRFEDEAPEYMEVATDYPLTGVGIPVHNVPLSHAAELGLPAAIMWATALVAAAAAAVVRPGPGSLDPWRLGMLALFLHWLIVANFGPLGYAFPNLLLWTWAGVAGLGHLSRPLLAEDR